MNKNLAFSNYLIFLLFISTMSFYFLKKENIIINKTKNHIRKTEMKNMQESIKLENNTISHELDFNDLIEIKQSLKKEKKNEPLVMNEFKIIPIKIDKKIQSISYSNLKNKTTVEKNNNNFDFKPLVKKLQKNNETRSITIIKKTEVISVGNSILETKNKFDISFKWPVKKICTI